MFFPRDEVTAKALGRAYCAPCRVREDCGAEADLYHDDGIRGGAWRQGAPTGRAARYQRIRYLIDEAPVHLCDVPKCCDGGPVPAGWHRADCGAGDGPEDACTCVRTVADLAQARERILAEYERGRRAAS